MKVPLLDLKRTYSDLAGEIARSLDEVLRSQLMILGRNVTAFEENLARLCGVRFAVGCGSGSDALLLALTALDVGPGDEVVTTPFTFFATAGSIARTGATPVFADIDPETFNLRPECVEAAVTDRTKVILPVHLYGQSADMEGILEVAGRRGLPVVEDAAQAIGATYHGRPCGSMGTMGCLSFYPSKNLGAAGEAGAVLTSDETLAALVRSLRVHGADPGEPYVHRRVGFNSRLDEVQAVVLNVKMKHLSDWTDERRALASRYTEELSGLDGVTTPRLAPGREHVWHQYVIRASRRDALATHLESRGVASRVFYPVPMHLQECFRSLGGRPGDFPEAERACAEVLSLPIFPGLTTDEQDHVCASIREFCARGRSRARTSRNLGTTN
ncbi:MAG TPA: DegT/DnrJ/EryC1/StrS family aminotransferase [Planctomycetota bacterium]|nr:DegT/DnrJ/EryC1/StrS family aminotransferase [Planctomycetota bacterium]